MNRGLDISVFLKMAGDLVKPLNDAEDRIKASTDRMKSNMSLSLKLAGAGAVATGIKMATNGIINNFTESYREVARASGDLRALGMQDMQAVIKEGQRLQNTYVGLSTEAFVRAAYDIKSGVSTLTDEGVAAMTASALTVAKATKGMPESMTSLFATSYGIFKKQFSEMSDADWGDMFGAALSASVQRFKTDGAKMQQAIESAGAGATNFGMKMTEQMTLLGMMQQQMQAGEAGTALKAFAANAARAHDAFSKMKITENRPVRVRVIDENGMLRKMPDILADLKARYGETLDTVEAAEIAKAFGTEEAMKMINALYGQEEAVRANAAALEDAARQGAAFTESMAANVDDYDGAGWELFQQQMKTIKEQIGAGLLPALDKLAPVFASMAEAVGGFISRNPELVAGLGAAIVGLSGIATVAAPVLFAFSSMTAMFATLRHGSVLLGIALRGTGTKAGLLSRGVRVLVGAFGLLKVALLGIGRALMANPIGLAIAAIAGGAYLIYRYWEPIKAFFSNLWAKVKSFTTNAWEGIKNAFLNYTPHGLIIQHWDSISGWFSGLWARVKTATTSAWDGIKSGFLNYTPHGLIITHWDSIAGWFTGLWSRVTTATTSAWDGIKSGFLNYTPHGLIITHWESITTWFSDLWGQVSTGATTAWEGIKTTLAGYSPSAILTNTWESVSTTFTSLWQGVSTATTSAWDGIKAGFLNYTPHGLIITHWDQIGTYFGTLWDDVKTTFSTKWEEIKTATTSWATDFLAIGGDILTGLSDGITGGVQAVIDTISGIGNSIVTTFKDILGIQSPSTVFSEFGGFLMDGLIGGLNAKIKAVKDKIMSIGDSVTSWFKEKLGIASPSKVFAGLGGHLSEGLAVGIDKQKGLVFASMEGIRRDLARPMLASATIGASAMMSAAVAAPSAAFGDIEQASAQIAQVGKSVSVSSSDTFHITITGEFNQDQEERLRLLLEEHERGKMLERERLLND